MANPGLHLGPRFPLPVEPVGVTPALKPILKAFEYGRLVDHLGTPVLLLMRMLFDNVADQTPAFSHWLGRTMHPQPSEKQALPEPERHHVP